VVRWHIITGEYPPQRGGVSDYTRLVACGLAAAGDEVEVWAPECAQPEQPEELQPGVRLHRLPGHFGPRALAMMDREISGADGNRILVQYVPHAFGLKAMNLPFCCWLYARRRRDITVMFHEVAFPRRAAQPLRHNLLGEVTTLMATLVARSARRIFVSSLAWEAMLRPLIGTTKSIEWLPVPSNVPAVNDFGATEAVRAKYAAGGLLVGHFSTYAPAVSQYLETTLPRLLQDGRGNVILLGRGGGLFRKALVHSHQAIADRLHAADGLDREEISVHLSACDLMIQPYAEGITTRRTSAMAALSHGRPVVTTVGCVTEPLWIESGAVASVPADDAAGLAPLAASLLQDQPARQRLGLAASRLYRDRFDLRHTISALRGTDADCDSQLVQP
jgi:glycosyltransferase involved in cell wall biosynthesis